MEFTYKVGEGLLANSFEVVEDRFRIVSVGGLPHHWSHNVAKQFGHGSKMDIVLEVQDRLIEINGWVAQESAVTQHLPLHLIARWHWCLEQLNQCLPHMSPVRIYSAACWAAPNVRAIYKVDG